MRWAVLAVLFATTATATARADTVSEHAVGSPSFDPGTVYKVPLGDSPRLGPADAPVTIVAWSDYACGYCNQVQETLDRLDRLYPGQLRWVWRELPLDDDHTIAAEAVLAAAAQGQFAPMHARMYALHGRVDRADVELVARELGLDMLRFRAALDTGAGRAQIAQDVADARALGVTGTPTFFVNGRPVHGAQPLEVFAQVVDEELARAAEVRATHPADLYAALVGSGKPTADASPDATNQAVELDPDVVYRVGLGFPGQSEGPDDAPVTIVEFSDFECPFCAKQAPVLAKLRQTYGDQVRIVYREFPVLFHPDSVIAAEAGAAAAAQGKFWAFHDQVFAHFGHLTRADLESYAKAAGLDLPRFRAALDARTYHDAVIAEGASAEALGVDGTPTMFVNGQPLSGVRSFDQLSAIIDANIKRVKAATDHGLPAKDFYAVAMADAKGQDRADPSRIPETSDLHVEPHPEDRVRSVDAACRLRDQARARTLAAPLTGGARARAVAVCAGEGIDL